MSPVFSSPRVGGPKTYGKQFPWTLAGRILLLPGYQGYGRVVTFRDRRYEYVGVVVRPSTRMTKSVATGRAPVTLGLTNDKDGTHTAKET